MRLPLLSLALACFALHPGGRAQSIRSDAATLVVNEVPVLTLRATIAGLSPERRAEALARRIREMTPGTQLSIKSAGQGRLLMADEQVLLEVSPVEAKEQASSPAGIANAWLYSLQSALSLPPLQVGAKSALIPTGGETTIGLVGSAAANAQVTVSNPEMVKLERRTGSLILKGVLRGESTVSIAGDGAAESIRVRVQPYAAQFPQTLTATVVGAPASADTIAAAVLGVVKTGVQAEAGRKLDVSVPDVSSMGTGETRTLAVKVKATAPDSIASEGIANVRVVNAGLAAREEGELWYCNDPESLKGPGILFRGELHAERPVRMLYHHINDSPQTLFMTVDVLNTSEVPAQVMIIPGDSRPDTNAVRAGVQAGEPFFQAWLTGSGEVVTIPAHCRLPVSFRRLGRVECGSGLAYLRLLPGGPESLVVHADARAGVPLAEPWLSASQSPTPWREVGTPVIDGPVRTGEFSDLVFPQPFRQEDVEYRVGGKFAFARIGQKPIPRKTKGAPLEGNFGVVYRINASAVNPTDRPVDIEVVFDASAGYSGALFVVDGVLRRLPLMQPKTEYQLARFRLAPGDRRVVRLMTIPLSGSSYPATVAVRPIERL